MIYIGLLLQSHLLWNWNMKNIDWMMSGAWLQSHLYGIEICTWYGWVLCCGTPIAPLWNWNLVRELFTQFLLSQLQSHLYGIEIAILSLVRPKKSLLQSHLYGIEITLRHLQTLLITGTPIAPLWNWNRKDWPHLLQKSLIKSMILYSCGTHF